MHFFKFIFDNILYMFRIVKLLIIGGNVIWWWIACILETFRGYYQKLKTKKVHLVGSITQFITMHGQYNINIKVKRYSS